MTSFTPQALYKTRQSPGLWFDSARALARAAELILREEEEVGAQYLSACDVAADELGGDIKAPRPNYVPAQLLYGFAIENLLKGLRVAQNPELASIDKLAGELNKHELDGLASAADPTLTKLDREFLVLLTHLIKWAGRYPIGLNLHEHQQARDLLLRPDGILGEWSAANASLRTIFERLARELEKHVPSEPTEWDTLIVFDD